MIKLYALHWSHFVEKVCWALDYKQLEWRQIDVDPFTKKEMRQLDVERIQNNGYKIFSFPTMLDSTTNTALSDSTPILEYLEKTYPTAPSLFPGDKIQQAEIKRWMLKLDSELGPDARRLGYTCCIIETPQLLPRYFAPNVATGTLRSWVYQVFISGMLIQRFAIQRAKEDHAYEKLEALLTSISTRLEGSNFLVGDEFSAADITLAALLRPLRVVPFFRDHEKLQPLFDWQEKMFADYDRASHMLYEKMILAHRLNKGYSMGRVPWLEEARFAPELKEENYDVAINDQHRVGRRHLWLAPWFYYWLRYFGGLKKLPSLPIPGTTASSHSP